MTEDELTALLTRLGAKDARDRARLQIEEGHPELERYLLVDHAIRCTVTQRTIAWIESALWNAPDAPVRPLSAALERVLASGASREDITTIVGVMQREAIQAVFDVLDNPTDAIWFAEANGWKLFQTNPDGAPLCDMRGLGDLAREIAPSEPDDARSA